LWVRRQVRFLALVHDGGEPVHLRVELGPQRRRFGGRWYVLAVAERVVFADDGELVWPGHRRSRFGQRKRGVLAAADDGDDLGAGLLTAVPKGQLAMRTWR
jgi:hypothetical protein